MYWRFTDRARKAMQLAHQEAVRLNNEYIGTEHILLGLVKEGSGVGANILDNLNIDLGKIRLEVEKIVQYGPDKVTMGRLPQTPRAKKAIENGIEEARKFNCEYVGTGHLLLGLMREREGVAAQVLMILGLELESVRDQITRILGQCGSESTEICPDIPVVPTMSHRLHDWLRTHSNLTIFICGVVATVSAEWIVLGLGGDASDVGAVLGGLMYVLAVALGFSASRSVPKQKG